MSQKFQRIGRFAPVAFVVLALLSGSAFFASNWHFKGRSVGGDSVAVAAPKPAAPGANPNVKPATKNERAAAQKTIQAQLRAFNTGNWTEAVKFQSAGLKGNFESPEAFGAMIEKIYPVFVRPKKVAFGRAQNVGGHIQFEVTLTGQDDSVHPALYSLVKEKGNYRVEAVLGGSAPQAEQGGNSTIA